MSEPDSPVLRLIPYLAAITAAILVALPQLGEADVLIAAVFAAAAYFGVYYLAKLIIWAILTRFDDDGDGS